MLGPWRELYLLHRRCCEEGKKLCCLRNVDHPELLGWRVGYKNEVWMSVRTSGKVCFCLREGMVGGHKDVICELKLLCSTLTIKGFPIHLKLTWFLSRKKSPISHHWYFSLMEQLEWWMLVPLQLNPVPGDGDTVESAVSPRKLSFLLLLLVMDFSSSTATLRLGL